MENNQARVHKHFRLNAAKIKRAQRVLRVDTETEVIERALDLLISEHKKNRVTSRANEKFLASGAVIKDVYGNLEH
jgi:ribosomal protein S4